MRKIIGCFVFMLLPACSNAGLPVSRDPNGAQESNSALGLSCPSTVEGICNGDQCLYMGRPFPAQPEGWCSVTAADGALWTAHRRTCGASHRVEWLDGDQPVDLYYDADGELYLLTRWESDPDGPCRGACRLTCVGGPPDAEPPACDEATDELVRPCAS